MEKLSNIRSYFVDQNFIEAMKLKLHNQMVASMNRTFMLKMFCVFFLFAYVGVLYLRNSNPVTN
ncbi:hypothetical protein PMLGA01_020005300 [Plasmodium malariae]|uniref:Uncharacterized protein n=1 Tax=Plasmodium malariae TaxID=5858 RepID=A0A1C3K9I2_PLAMA|nr:hypothetical protein PMLGA01_020005300 [Plasmodium malariae]